MARARPMEDGGEVDREAARTADKQVAGGCCDPDDVEAEARSASPSSSMEFTRVGDSACGGATSEPVRWQRVLELRIRIEKGIYHVTPERVAAKWAGMSAEEGGAWAGAVLCKELSRRRC